MSEAEDLVSKMFSGDRLSLALLVAKVKNRDKDLAEIMKLLYPKTGKAQVLGITGPPGLGKSTVIDKMTSLYRAQDKKVAIVGIDHVRAEQSSEDAGVYYCSLKIRASRVGLSHAMKEILIVLDSAQFDVIFVETAGLGQSEFEVLKLAQTVVAVLSSESGHSAQAMKTGLIEIADLFVVNNSGHFEVGQVADGKTNVDRETSIDELLALIEKHQIFLETSGKLQLKRIEFIKNEVGDILSERLSLSLDQQFKTSSGVDLLEKLSHLELDPYEAADLLSGV